MLKRVGGVLSALALACLSLGTVATPASALATPQISSVASPSTTVGLAIFDVVDLTGGSAPTGTLTFDLFGPNNSTCSGTPAFMSTVPVSGDGSYDSNSFTTTQAGIYRWQASYSGDGSNSPVGPTSCSDASESTTVAQVSPVLTTTASAGVSVGGSIDDSAKLSGGITPTGTITFDLWASVAACQAQGTPSFNTSVAVNLGNAIYPSAPFSPITPGTYVWTALYSGDSNNLAVSDINCLDSNETVTVTPASSTPILTTTASASVAVGGSVSDTASLVNGNNPTGTITFNLFGPGDATCSRAPAFTAMVPVHGNGSYNSGPFITETTGAYQWTAAYSGDSANNPVASACGASGESVAVTTATTTISTQASPAVSLGGAVRDTATLTGGFSPTGTITFDLFGPGNPTCTGTDAFSNTVTVNGDGNYTSSPFTPTAAGTYEWRASYSGDTNSNPAGPTTCDDAAETVTVSSTTTTSTSTTTTTTTVPATTTTSSTTTTTTVPATTTTSSTTTSSTTSTTVPTTTTTTGSTTTTTSPTLATPTISTMASPNVTVGGSVSDSASLSGGVNPAGSITFSLFGPFDQTCTSTPAFTAMVPVHGNGAYSSGPFATELVGNYFWTAAYSGDSNNKPATSACGAASEQVTASRASTALTTQASPSVAVGSAISDTASLTGGFSPTGTITFDLFGPGNPTCGGTVAFSTTVTVNGDGNYTSSPFMPTAAGTYEWVASYLGDPQSLPAGPTACGDAAETVTVTTGATTTTTGATTTTTTGSTTTTTTTTGSTTTTTTGPTTTTTTGSTTTTTTGPTTTTTVPATTTTSTTSSSTTSTTSTTSSTTGRSTTTTVGSTTTTTAAPRVQVSPSTVPAGQSTMVSGSGFPAGSELPMDLFSTPVSLGTAIANSLGNFAVTVVIPAATAAGQHTIVVSTADASVRAQASITVTAAPAPTGATGTTISSLSLTGASIKDPTMGGALLILAGVLSLGVTWRRRRVWSPRRPH